MFSHHQSTQYVTHPGIVSCSGLIIRPTPTASDSYSDLALLSMKRILSSFTDVRNFGTKVRYIMSRHIKKSYQIMHLDMHLDSPAHAFTIILTPSSNLAPAAAFHPPSHHVLLLLFIHLYTMTGFRGTHQAECANGNNNVSPRPGRVQEQC